MMLSFYDLDERQIHHVILLVALYNKGLSCIAVQLRRRDDHQGITMLLH
ncbi:hypothetical protein N9R79_11160 [Vibrio sp.]|nr:hypothetical protein [Vibrio sp.]